MQLFIEIDGFLNGAFSDTVSGRVAFNFDQQDGPTESISTGEGLDGDENTGLLLEDTHDWFAQDDDGNVWYMGEDVDNYDEEKYYGPHGSLFSGLWDWGS